MMDRVQIVVTWCVVLTTLLADVYDLFVPKHFFENWIIFCFWNLMALLIVVYWILEFKKIK